MTFIQICQVEKTKYKLPIENEPKPKIDLIILTQSKRLFLFNSYNVNRNDHQLHAKVLAANLQFLHQKCNKLKQQLSHNII